MLNCNADSIKPQKRRKSNTKFKIGLISVFHTSAAEYIEHAILN